MARKQQQPAVEKTEPLFTRQDYELLRRERRRLDQLIGVIESAEACGVACDTFKQVRQQLADQLAAIEHHFMNPIPE